MVIERGKEIGRRIAIAKIFSPTWLSTIGMRECFTKQLEITTIDDTSRWSRHIRLAVHRGEGRDVAKCADRTASNFGPMRLAAVLENADPAAMR